jgi:hypothetical protein
MGQSTIVNMARSEDTPPQEDIGLEQMSASYLPGSHQPFSQGLSEPASSLEEHLIKRTETFEINSSNLSNSFQINPLLDDGILGPLGPQRHIKKKSSILMRKSTIDDSISGPLLPSVDSSDVENIEDSDVAVRNSDKSLNQNPRSGTSSSY